MTASSPSAPSPLFLAFALAAFAAAVSATIVVPGITPTTLPSADFFHASAAYTNVTGPLVPIAVGAGCVPVVPLSNTSSGPYVAYFNFGVAQLTGCTSFADLINAPSFANLDASLYVFSLPPQANWQEGYFDPLGYVSTYIGKGYKLVCVGMAASVQLDALAANGTVVTVESDVGDWIRFSQTGQFKSFQIVFGIIFWGISAASLFINIRSVLKDGSAYRIVKYNNIIYWVMFFASTVLAIDTIDPYGFNGIFTIGQWMNIRYGGIMITMGLTALLTSAWARVTTSSPVQSFSHLRWAAHGIQFVIYASYIIFVVCAMVSCQRWTYLQVYGNLALSLKNTFNVCGGALLFMCVSGMFFGLSLLLYLRTFSSLQGAHRTTNTRITLLMLAASFDQLLFAILTYLVNDYYLSVQTYFSFMATEHAIMLLVFVVIIVSLNVSGLKFSTFTDSASSPRRESASSHMKSSNGKATKSNGTSSSAEGASPQSSKSLAAVDNPDEFVKTMSEMSMVAIDNGLTAAVKAEDMA